SLTFLTSHLSFDVDRFDISDDGSRIAFTTNEDGTDVLRILDVSTGKDAKVGGLPPGTVGALRWHKNGRDLGFSFSGARSPADVYSVDAGGKVERWTESETGGLTRAKFAEPELIRWKSFDGKTISGFLYKPVDGGTGKRPVIINIHGGPEGQSRPGFLGRNNYFVSDLGVVMIFPNVRGSTGFGKTFSQ